jgi:hypothetical protein
MIFHAEYGPVCVESSFFEGLDVFQFLVDSHTLSPTTKVTAFHPAYFVVTTEP